MKLERLRRIANVTTAAAVVTLAACRSATAPAAGSAAVFVVDVSGERFRVLLRDDALIAHARRILSGSEPQKIVNGDLASGNGGFNTGWSWHLKPEGIGFADATIELCDGRPSMVEANL